MAEETKEKPTEQPQTQPQEQQQIHPQVTVHAQYVKDFSFENPNAPKSLAASDTQPEIEINVNVSANPQEQERQFEAVLSLKATAKRGDEAMFVAELAYAAIMTIDDSVEQNMLHPLVMIEGPRMLFPFARHILSSMTQAGGFMPLNLQPIDFVRLYQASAQANAEQRSTQQVGDGQANEPELNLDNIDIEGSESGASKGKKASAKKAKEKAKKN